MELDESGSNFFGGNVSDPFAPATEPDPFEQPTKPKQKAATKKAVRSVSPQGTTQYGEGFRAATGLGGPDAPPDLPSDEIDIGGKTYKFSAVTDPTGNVESYTAQGPEGAVKLTPADYKYLKYVEGQNAMVPGKPGETEQPGDPHQLSDKEYDTLTQEASRGNKLAQEILVKGHYKAKDFPTLTQDLQKMADPFVNALSNLPNVASTAESQLQAVTQPYDFANAEGQVNNILTNQMGMAALAQPSAATSSFVSKVDQIASTNPLTQSTLGLPTIESALGELGPAAKLSTKATPNAALLQALLSHIQYQDVYGTGLSSTAAAQNNPNWLQQLIAAVNLSDLGGGIPGITSAASAARRAPSASTTGPGGVPNTG
jgi:hypothetical protein